MIYIACFAISAFYAYLDSRNEQKKQIGIFGWIAILLPAVLAGLRDISVGTDTKAYVLTFRNMSGQSFSQFLTDKTGMEIGFRILFFAVSRFTDDPAWALFFAHLFIMFFLYKALKDNSIGKYNWLGLTIFNLLFFSQSLNLLRQFMALTMILWGFQYVRTEKFIKWLVVILLASMFHITSIVSIFIYFLYQIYAISTCRTYKNRTVHHTTPEKKIIISFCLVAGTTLIFLYSRQLLLLVHNVTGRFEVQADNIRDYFAIDIYDFLNKVLFLIPFVLFSKSEANANGDCNFYSVLITISMILTQLNMVSYNAGRIAIPFWIMLVIAVPTLVSKLKNRKNRTVVSVYYLLLCGWVYLNNFVIKGYSEVMPYTSCILGIG